MVVLIKQIYIVSVFVLGVFLGYMAGKSEYKHDSCYDATGKYTDYTAWLSVRDGIHRCFWIEKNYPWRVKLQGVIDVK
jgi:hypothetical protein